MTTSADIVNRALELIDSQSFITSLSDSTTEAQAASVVYTPTVQLLLRELDPDFARATVTLTASGAPSVVPPWSYEYGYPADCLRARQVRPPVSGAGSLADPYDPQPVLAQVSFDPNGGGASVAAKVILTNQQNALLNYTTSAVTENQWDAAFAEAVARRLGNPLAMAISGRPDFARELLEESERYAGMAELVDDSSDGTA